MHVNESRTNTPVVGEIWFIGDFAVEIVDVEEDIVVKDRIAGILHSYTCEEWKLGVESSEIRRSSVYQ